MFSSMLVAPARKRDCTRVEMMTKSINHFARATEIGTSSITHFTATMYVCYRTYTSSPTSIDPGTMATA